MAFDFFLPNFTPYTRENYASSELNPMRVVVEVEPVDPAYLAYNPAGVGVAEARFESMRPLMSGEEVTIEGYAMTTRSKRTDYFAGQYYGIFESASGAKALMDYWGVPDERKQYPPNATMQYWYYTPKFGGAKVWVRMHSTYLNLLKKIDAEVWRKINESIVKEVKKGG